MRRLVLAISFVAAPAAVAAQNGTNTTSTSPSSTTNAAPPRAAAGPPVTMITTASAISKEPFGSIYGVRELDDGRVLVNDGAKRRLLIMDTTLTTVGVALDSLPGIDNAYGSGYATMMKYRGDSTLVFDNQAFAMLLLDGKGKIASVRAIWSSGDAVFFGTRGENVDAKGRITFRVPAKPTPPKVMPPAGVPWIPDQPDSAFIVAVDLDTRKMDTLGVVRQPKTQYRVRQSAEGYFSLDYVQNPLPVVDTWGVLEDGTVAIIRGIDYRVDFLNPDGKWTSSPKQPYDWQRLTDEDKSHMVDSIRGMIQKQAQTQFVSNMIRWANMYNKKKLPSNLVVPDGYVPPPGMAKDWVLPPGVKLPANYIWQCGPDENPVQVPVPSATPPAGATPGAAPPGAAPGSTPPGSATSSTGAKPPAGGSSNGSATGGGVALPGAATATQLSCYPGGIFIGGGPTPPAPVLRVSSVVEASDLPDYKPPFTETAKADRDGNIWVRPFPTKGPMNGGPVIYDVISHSGEMTNRIQLPPGYTLIGFGKGKVVYLQMRDAAGLHLARVRLK